MGLFPAGMSGRPRQECRDLEPCGLLLGFTREGGASVRSRPLWAAQPHTTAATAALLGSKLSRKFTVHPHVPTGVRITGLNEHKGTGHQRQVLGMEATVLFTCGWALGASHSGAGLLWVLGPGQQLLGTSGRRRAGLVPGETWAETRLRPLPLRDLTKPRHFSEPSRLQTGTCKLPHWRRGGLM